MSWRRRISGGSNGGYSFDQRTGFRVEGRKLKQDAEKGIWTTDPDPLHPQRYVRTPGPDGGHWRPGLPAHEKHGDDWRLKTYWWTIDGGYQQRERLRLVATPTQGFSDSIGDYFSIGAAVNAAANPMTFEES